jgi:hypothetical protein
MSTPLIECPLGFPLSEKQARNLDTLLKALPKSKEFKYVKTVFLKAPTELNPGERSDVSWISTETPDRYDHVVFAKGMNDTQFALNPIVTLNHDYPRPPIGRSLWREFAKDGVTRGIKAKTVYPPMPASWPAGEMLGAGQGFRSDPGRLAQRQKHRLATDEGPLRRREGSHQEQLARRHVDRRRMAAHRIRRRHDPRQPGNRRRSRQLNHPRRRAGSLHHAGRARKSAGEPRQQHRRDDSRS